MAKASEKIASKESESQRGKSRFAVQPRSGRSVLPDRPPREVDNEIVSILLGGDPASLAAQTPAETRSAVAEVPPPLSKAEVAPVIQDLRQDEKSAVSESEDVSRDVEASAQTSSETGRTKVSHSQPIVSPTSEAPALSSQQQPNAKSDSSVSTSVIGARATSLPQPDIGRSSIAVEGQIQGLELVISTFEEFAERWKHGLRKGQLKVCEVLYQKTYALGTTECVTSFSELGRLSGLKMRQCFNIIAQLEALKFVERAKSENTSNKKDQGSIIRFFLFPKS
jgi:hypothetical protein